jgi:hypothetical protein
LIFPYKEPIGGGHGRVTSESDLLAELVMEDLSVVSRLPKMMMFSSFG